MIVFNDARVDKYNALPFGKSFTTQFGVTPDQMDQWIKELEEGESNVE